MLLREILDPLFQQGQVVGAFTGLAPEDFEGLALEIVLLFDDFTVVIFDAREEAHEKDCRGVEKGNLQQELTVIAA